MNLEQIEHQVMQTIRETCKAHGVRLVLDIGHTETDETKAVTHCEIGYDLNPKRRLHLKITQGLAFIAGGMTIGSFIANFFLPPQFPYEVLVFSTALALNRHIAAQPEMTPMEWNVIMTVALHQRGFVVQFDPESGRTLIGCYTERPD